MTPENLRVGGGLAATQLHPAVLIAMILSAALILLLPRKYAIVPLILMSFLVPIGEQLVVSGVHVFVLRVLILVALIRVSLAAIFSKARLWSGGRSSIDTVFILWTLFHVITFVLLFSLTTQAVVNQFGYVWDFLGGYLVLRALIVDEDDIGVAIKALAAAMAITAVCMLNEHFRMQNVFGYIGGALTVPETRDGLVRAQAAFSHPLLAGAFGATALPLFLLLWKQGKSKGMAAVGILSATIVTVCAASSTPILAYFAGIGGLCFWPFRKSMRIFRWGIVFALIGLQIVMKAPVWYVISHVQLMGASSSSHRAELVDMFIRHFGDWWLIGTTSNGTWGFDMWDTSNQYVGEGVGGGLACLLCFFGLIYLAFRRVGNARKAVEGDAAKEWYFWFLGAAMFSHVVVFFGISYFDQTRMTWFALLAIIVTATAPLLEKNKQPELQPAEAPAELPRELSPYPWLTAPARKKAMVGQSPGEFKPRRS